MVPSSALSPDHPAAGAPPASDRSQWGKGPGAPEEIRFLQGAQPRVFELVRAVRIFFEFLRGFRALHFVGPCVTVFGSARFKAEHPGGE